MKKIVATGALAASLIGGSVAIAALTPVGLAGAQDDPPTEPAPADETAESPHAGRGHRGELLREVLDSLVADGTLTQDQADAVVERLEEQVAEHRAEREARRAEMQQAVADALGITVEELEAARADGQTIADLAGDDVDAVIDTLVAAAIARADEALTADDITQEQHDRIVENVEERITALVNGEGRGPGGPGRPGGFGGPGEGGGPGGFGGPGERGFDGGPFGG